MHAIVCHKHGGPDVMRFEEAPRPEVGAGEVLVQTQAVGVNFVDTMRRSGNHPAAPKPPFTPGIEFCGHVVAVGASVDRFCAGQRVIGRCETNGAYAEYVAAEARFTVECPDDIPADDAAAIFVNGQTAYHALVTKGHVNEGETVLVTAAAGGVGTCAVQIAKALGAFVIGAASTHEKLRLIEDLGADRSVDYSLAHDWPQQVLDATNGQGVDLILESVGGEIATRCLQCCAPGGRIVVFGKASGSPVALTGDDLLFGNRTAYGLALGNVIEDEQLMRAAMDQIFAWIAEKKLKLVIGRRFPLSEAAAAHRALQSRSTHGKIVLSP